MITYTSSNLVRSYKSNSPILIVSGHGGTYHPPNVPLRVCTGLPVSCDCKTLSDLYTIDIAQRIANNLDNSALTPSVLIADFRREYVDVNRSQDCGVGSPEGLIYWSTFHNKARELVDNIRLFHPVGFLFDIHGTMGTSSDVWSAYIGTLNGNTGSLNTSVKQLLNNNPLSLYDLQNMFTSYGYAIQPAVLGESELISGEYVLKTYGSQNMNGINSFQIEIDDSIRYDVALRNKFADDVSNIIFNFVSQNEPITCSFNITY